MATITQKQVQAINAKCRNGFRLDLEKFFIQNKKALYKFIVLEKGKKAIRLELFWADELVDRENIYGCVIPQCTGNVVPKLNCSVFYKPVTSEFWSGSGFGQTHEFKEYISTKRRIKVLSDLSELVTDDLVCEMLPEREREEFRQKRNR